MTETDVRVVVQNSHFVHYLFDLLRLVDEGVPVASFVEMGTNSQTANIEKHIADEVLRMKTMFSEKAECIFKEGDTIRCMKGYIEVTKAFLIVGFVKILVDDKLCDACILDNKEFCDMPIIVPTSIINENYTLCTK